MNIYYEPPEPQDDNTGNELLDKVAKIVNQNLIDVTHKYKYRLMWELRNLESRIDEERGVIIMKEKGVQTRDFSKELTEEIGEILKTINWEVW